MINPRRHSRLGKALYSGRVLLMDGAMGTQLQRAGVQQGECCELWNLTRPHEVRAIQQAYVDAGAECLLTNTFQSNAPALARYGLEHRLEEINRAAVEIATSVAGPNHFILGDIGPVQAPDTHGRCGDPKTVERVVRSLACVDGLLVETLSNSPFPFDFKPVLLSFAFVRDTKGGLHTLTGLSPEQCAAAAKEHGAVALGVNCGRDIDMNAIIEIVRRYRQVTDLPLFARPNAGTPSFNDGRWVYPQSPEAMAARLPELLKAGVNMVGGCCGTTPEHIAAFRLVVDEWNARSEGPKSRLQWNRHDATERAN